jgi:hypothetical protein
MTAHLKCNTEGKTYTNDWRLKASKQWQIGIIWHQGVMADWDHMTSRGDVIGWLQPGSNHGESDSMIHYHRWTVLLWWLHPQVMGSRSSNGRGDSMTQLKHTQHRDPSSKAPPAGSYPYQLKSCSEYIWAVQYCIQTDCLIKQNAQTAVAFFAKSRLG